MDSQFDGFAINLELDDDGAWLAHFVEAPEISAFAATPADALAELVVAWETVKETYRADGRPVPIAPARKSYSGAFNVRIDKILHRALAVEAARQGVSLNAIVAKKLIQTTATR